MSSALLPPALVTAGHLARLACVYVRQSSPGQVARHAESTELQYAWSSARSPSAGRVRSRCHRRGPGAPGQRRRRARPASSASSPRWAWPGRPRPQLESLPAGAQQQRLAPPAGAVRPVRRPPRRRRAAVYDPSDSTTACCWGCQGMMSEAELHLLKQRLHEGRSHKARARRTAAAPAGRAAAPGRTARSCWTPTSRSRRASGWSSTTFAAVGSAQAVVRYSRRRACRCRRGRCAGRALRAAGAGSRPRSAAGCWPPAEPGLRRRLRLRAHHPDPTRRRPGHPQSGTVRRALEECPVVLRDVYPAYLSLGRLPAEPAAAARQPEPLPRGAAGGGAPGPGAPPGHRPVRAVRPPDAPDLLGASRRLPGLQVQLRRRRVRRAAPARRCGRWRWTPPWGDRAGGPDARPAGAGAGGGRGTGRRGPGAGAAVAAAAWSGRATRPSGRSGSTRRASRRTGWWPARWSASGSRRCGAPRRWSRRRPPGAVSKRRGWTRPGARRSWRWRTTCRRCGTRRRPRRPTASGCCGWWCATQCWTAAAPAGGRGCRFNWQTGASTEHWVTQRVATYRHLRRPGGGAAAGRPPSRRRPGGRRHRGGAERGRLPDGTGQALPRRGGVAAAQAGDGQAGRHRPAAGPAGRGRLLRDGRRHGHWRIPGTIYHWLWAGRLEAHHNRKGGSWAIYLSSEDITRLGARLTAADRPRRRRRDAIASASASHHRRSSCCW